MMTEEKDDDDDDCLDDELPLSVEYWVSRGHKMRYAKAMVELAKDLNGKSCIAGIDSVFRCVELKPRLQQDQPDQQDQPQDQQDNGQDNGQESEKERIMLAYEDLLLPYWRKFASQLLEAWQNRLEAGDEFTLSITDVELAPPVLQILQQSLQEAPLNNLMLVRNASNASSGQDLLLFAAGLVKNKMQRLNLSENPILRSAAASLAISIAAANLRQVVLAGCGLGDHPDILSCLLRACRNVPILDLTANRISPHASFLLSHLLSTNPHMHSLYLNNNLLDDHSAIALAQALKTNTHLQHLGLAANPHISPLGGHALFQAIYDHQTLNAIADSNHTCVIWADPQSYPTHLFIDNARTPALNQRYKIAYAINTSTISSLLTYFEHVPVILMPYVLHCIQTKAERNIPMTVFNRLYQLVKQWNMPLLFIQSQ